VHGCTAHGIGAALMEDCAYDGDGNLLASTFSDYTPITAMNMPDLLCGHMESPSPVHLNGAKGMGEGGASAGPHDLRGAAGRPLFDRRDHQ